MSRYRFLNLTLLALTALFAILSAAPEAGKALGRQGGSTINLGPIQPAKLGWGQTGLFNAYVARNGRPVKGVYVEFWFSGRHGAQTGHWYVRTDSAGRASFTATVPYSWRYNDTWVDLNAACTSIGAYNMWRVRGK